MLVFSKYQGAGNDFVVVDMREAKAALSPEVVVELCDRHKGIGADGVLSLWSHELADGEMRIQNADGSNAGMCGNGMRCMLQFLFDLEVVEADRTGLERRTFDILGFPVPHMQIPLRPGRDMARLVEGAAMVQAGRYLGHDSAHDFNQKLLDKMNGPKA